MTHTENQLSIPVSDYRLLFRPGHIDIDPSALKAMNQHKCLPIKLLARHITGDWGIVGEDEARTNHQSIQTGNRIHSRYPLSENCSIWVITDWGQPVTTFVLRGASQ